MYLPWQVDIHLSENEDKLNIVHEYLWECSKGVKYRTPPHTHDAKFYYCNRYDFLFYSFAVFPDEDDDVEES